MSDHERRAPGGRLRWRFLTETTLLTLAAIAACGVGLGLAARTPLLLAWYEWRLERCPEAEAPAILDAVAALGPASRPLLESIAFSDQPAAPAGWLQPSETAIRERALHHVWSQEGPLAELSETRARRYLTGARGLAFRPLVAALAEEGVPPQLVTASFLDELLDVALRDPDPSGSIGAYLALVTTVARFDDGDAWVVATATRVGLASRHEGTSVQAALDLMNAASDGRERATPILRRILGAPDRSAIAPSSEPRSDSRRLF